MLREGTTTFWSLLGPNSYTIDPRQPQSQHYISALDVGSLSPDLLPLTPVRVSYAYRMLGTSSVLGFRRVSG